MNGDTLLQRLRIQAYSVYNETNLCISPDTNGKSVPDAICTYALCGALPVIAHILRIGSSRHR